MFHSECFWESCTLSDPALLTDTSVLFSSATAAVAVLDRQGCWTATIGVSIQNHSKTKECRTEGLNGTTNGSCPNFEGPDPSHGMERFGAFQAFICPIFSNGGPRSYDLSFLTTSQFCYSRELCDFSCYTCLIVSSHEVFRRLDSNEVTFRCGWGSLG